MRDGWIVLRTFVTDFEAQEARSRLEALGLQSLVEADNCGGMRPHLDLTTGVKLLVPQEEEAQARELIMESTTSPSGDPWLCGGCGENIEPGFDACWKCGRDRD
ncbi:MAG: hypothetical protein KOO60_11935 [Gemmatimonadales bacterium]|nr:hypothetical protein [Gemmatimonadales bacterium]